MSVNIRAETPADVERIDEVTRAAFREAPHASRTEQFIVRALRTAGALSASLVAEVDGSIVGHVAVSPVSIPSATSGWFGVGPVSVLPECQRRGIGSLLMKEALARLRERGAGGCVVLGAPRFYGRFGFRSEPGPTLPNVPREAFQAVSFGASVPRGVVAYHEAFGAQG